MSGVGQFRMSPAVRAKWMAARTTHGAYAGGGETSEHYIWREMRRRTRENHKGYEDVEVCERWETYENFLADMGPRPSLDHQLDRKNPFGHYEPGNVRWVTRSVQQKNRRATKFWEQNGEIMVLSDWALRLDISNALACWRWKNWGTFVIGRTWQLLQRIK